METNVPALQQQLQQLLQSKAVTPATRKALQDRMEEARRKPAFFTPHAFALLSIVCDRLMGQDSKARLVNVAVFMDTRLALNTGDGWRYNELPPDGELYTTGLAGIDETAACLFSKPFLELDLPQQEEVLTAIQQGSAPGKAWQALSPTRFFEELLAEATEVYYSYPLVQLSIGYRGMADGDGWVAIGLDEGDHNNFSV